MPSKLNLLSEAVDSGTLDLRYYLLIIILLY